MDFRASRSRGSQPPRMPRGGGNHHQQQGTRMMAWQSNSNNTYHSQDENMAYQQPTVETYQGSYYPHNHLSPELINSSPQAGYAFSTHSPCYVPQHIYPNIDHPAMYINTAIPLSTAPSQSGVNSLVQTPKLRFNCRDSLFTCSNCHHKNSLFEIELNKKDDEIARLRQESAFLRNRVQELEEMLSQYEPRNLSETGLDNVLQAGSDNPIYNKVTQLSPEAKEFNPEKPDKIYSTNPVTSATEVPVVSAKVFNDEPVHEIHTEIVEETPAEEIEVEDVHVEQIEMSESVDKNHTEEIFNIEMSSRDNQTVQNNSKPVAYTTDFGDDATNKDVVNTQLINESSVSQQDEIGCQQMLPEVADGTWEETQDPVTPSDPSLPFEEVDRNSTRIGDQQLSLESQNAQGKTRSKKLRDSGSNTSFTGGNRGRGSRKGEQDHCNDKSQQNFSHNRSGNNYSSNYNYNQRSQNFNKQQKHTDGQRQDMYRDNSRDRHKDNFPKENHESFSRDIKNGSSRDGFPREQRESGGPGRRGDKQPNNDAENYTDQKGRITGGQEQNDEANFPQRSNSRGRGGARTSWDSGRRWDKQPNSNVENYTHQMSRITTGGQEQNEEANFPQRSTSRGRGGARTSWDSGFVANSNRRPFKNIVKEIKGDLFNAPPDFSLAHCVAKDFRMGSGIAVKFRLEFKRISELLDQNVDVGGCAFLEDKERYIFYMVTKHVSNDKPTYESFRKSLNDMRDKCVRFGVNKLALPHIGCGLDRLDWSKVRQMINEAFHETDTQICAYDFNSEGLPEGEGNKLPGSLGTTVKYQIMNLCSIEPHTALVFLGTEDGHMDNTAVSLNNKFKFVAEYRKAPKSVGSLWCYTRLNNYYIYSLIVSKTCKEKVLFANVEPCCHELSKQLRKEKFEYTGIEVFMDWSEDDTFTEKIVTLLRYTLPKSMKQLWVCYPEKEFDVHSMAAKQASKQH